MSRSRKNIWLTSLTTIALVSLMVSILTHFGSTRTSLAAPFDRNMVNVWLTTADLRTHLDQQGNTQFSTGDSSEIIKITVDDTKVYQSIDGFGASLTDGSAWLISQKMSQQQRNDLMVKLFDPVRGIGLDFLRQPMGASDLTTPTSGEYTYDDVPAGQTDSNLTHFSIAHDQAYIIPLLQQALKINPHLKIMATPWSPPAWMKSNDSLEGGTLNTSAYAAYAQYFVKYIQAYQAQSIPIYAVTVQNEPLYQPTGYPGMSLPADQEATFIGQYLAPAFAQNHISTKILGYDHNWDQPSYPTTLLSNQTANAALAGTAWHCYAGQTGAQTQVHDAYPTKDTYETECAGGQWEMNNGLPGTANLMTTTVRNWSKTVVRWGLALDPNGQPNLGTGASCTQCRGIVTIDQKTGNVTYNGDYYALGQASKFLQSGATRIDSSAGSNGITDVAFQNPDGSKVLYVYNTAASSQRFAVQWGGQWFSYSLPGGAVATFKWSGTQTTGGGSGLVALDRTGWIASASATDTNGDSPAHALDGDANTHWGSGEAQSPGLWFQVNMITPRPINSISLDAGPSTGDYPRAYMVFVSLDGSNWGHSIASGDTTSQGSGAYVTPGQLITISFPVQQARFIRVVDLGSAGNWWSIYEFNVYAKAGSTPTPLDRTGWSATASASNTGEPPSNALDGVFSTRWSSGQPQSVGMSFQVNMGKTQSVRSIALDCGPSGGDYPRGYQVFVSSDGSTWGSAIASGQGTSGYTLISFVPQSTRYIKVVLTANSGSWWSIDEFYAFA
ncbi:MAG TPA: discoidin domain-containing protein [Ktedonobacteraceae bacterium]|nr:discoidin domain-containing protein [Ktedonobacteraceae bacterium]